MAYANFHGPEYATHLHTAFEDPDAQAATELSSSDILEPAVASPSLNMSQSQPSVQCQHPDPASSEPPQSPPRGRHRHRQHRDHTQSLLPPRTSSHRRPRMRHAASSPPPRLPYRPPRPHTPSTAHSFPISTSPSRSLSPSPHLSSPTTTSNSARNAPYPPALDGTLLAAACAAAPLTTATSHLYRSPAPSSYRGAAAGGGGGGLRRGDSTSGLPNIHPDILDDLRALDDLEGGALLRPLLTQPGPSGGGEEGVGGGGGGEGGGEGGGDGGGGGGGGAGGEGVVHVDEAETYEVPELLQAKPRDVLQFIEEEGVVKVAEFEVADGLALRAFGGEPFLVTGDDHAEPPGLVAMWMERLGEGGKVQGTGWKSTLSVEAHVVNLYDAAAPGTAGLLRPLLARLRVHGCPATVFALPAVQAVIALKWNTWARHFLLAEFMFYALWLAAFSAFSLLLEDGPEQDGGGGEEEGGENTWAGAFTAEDSGAAGLPFVRVLYSAVQSAATAITGSGASAGGGVGSAAGVGAAGGMGGGECGVRFLALWDWSSLGLLVSSWRGVGQLGASTAAVAAMLPFLYTELCTARVQGLAWVTFFNLLDVTSYCLAAGLWAVHVRCGSLPASPVFSGALALQHVLLWSKLHYYARVLAPTRGGFHDTLRMVLGELRGFLTFVGLVMLGYAFAFYCLFRQDRDEFSDFSTLWHSFAAMFAYMLQMFDYSVLYNSTHPVLAMVLFMSYELMVAVLLLNIMIALMTSAFARVSADEGLRYLVYKAEVIDELESTLPAWLQRPTWFPHFVHVLKVSPRSTYEINLNSVWSGMSNLQSSLMNAQQETRLRVEVLEGKVDVIDQKLSAAVRLLASRLLTHSELAAALAGEDDVAEASGSEAAHQDLDLDMETGEPDPEAWRDADLDPRPEEQAVPEAAEEDEEGRGGGGGRLAVLRGLGGVGGGGGTAGNRRERRPRSRRAGGGGEQEGGEGAGSGRHGGSPFRFRGASVEGSQGEGSGGSVRVRVTRGAAVRLGHPHHHGHPASHHHHHHTHSHGHGHGSSHPASTSYQHLRYPTSSRRLHGAVSSHVSPHPRGPSTGSHPPSPPHLTHQHTAPPSPLRMRHASISAAAATPAGTVPGLSAARLHAFYSQGHGHGYPQHHHYQHHHQQHPQEQHHGGGSASGGGVGGTQQVLYDGTGRTSPQLLPLPMVPQLPSIDRSGAGVGGDAGGGEGEAGGIGTRRTVEELLYDMWGDWSGDWNGIAGGVGVGGGVGGNYDEHYSYGQDPYGAGGEPHDAADAVVPQSVRRTRPPQPSAAAAATLPPSPGGTELDDAVVLEMPPEDVLRDPTSAEPPPLPPPAHLTSVSSLPSYGGGQQSAAPYPGGWGFTMMGRAHAGSGGTGGGGGSGSGGGGDVSGSFSGRSSGSGSGGIFRPRRGPMGHQGGGGGGGPVGGGGTGGGGGPAMASIAEHGSPSLAGSVAGSGVWTAEGEVESSPQGVEGQGEEGGKR